MSDAKAVSAMPLRVVHVVSGDLYGGAESMVESLVRIQADDPDLSVSAVLFNDATLAARLRTLGVALHVLDERRMSAVSQVAAITRLVSENGADVVHTHGRKEDILGSISARLAGRAVSLRTVHGAPEHPRAWRHVRTRLLEYLDRQVARRLQSHAVAVSADLADKLGGLLPGAKIRLIRNGIDANHVRRLAAGGDTGLPGAGATRIVFLGRLYPVKRVDRIIDATRDLQRSDPGGYELLIAGDGPLRPELEARVGAAGLDGVVHFLGFRADALSVLRDSAVLVLASEHEGTPMCVLEALALGVPVVAPRTGGLPELVATDSGILLDDLGPGAIAGAIRQVTASGWIGRPQVPEAYRLDVVARQYKALYAEANRG